MLPKYSRFFGWVLIVGFCSAFVTAFAFASEIGCPHLNWAASSVHREHVSASASLTDRIVQRLEEAELHESDPWYRDSMRIARLTVIYAANGDPSPHFWATYQVLRTSPDQVWPHLVRERQAKLGSYYESIFGEQTDVNPGVNLPPKKPAASVAVDRIRRRAKAAAA